MADNEARYQETTAACLEKYKAGEFRVEEFDDDRDWRCYFCLKSVKGECVIIKITSQFFKKGEIRFHRKCLDGLI